MKGFKGLISSGLSGKLYKNYFKGQKQKFWSTSSYKKCRFWKKTKLILAFSIEGKICQRQPSNFNTSFVKYEGL